MTLSLCLRAFGPSKRPITTSRPRQSTPLNPFVRRSVPLATTLLRLGLGQETAEKQPPSALDFVGFFQQAMEADVRRTGKKRPICEAVHNLVSQYNQGTSVRKWKVDGAKKKIVINLMRSPTHVRAILAAHYDQHNHATSGTLLTSVFFLCFSLRARLPCSKSKRRTSK